MKERIRIVSQERVSEEFAETAQSPKPSIGAERCFQTGLLHLVSRRSHRWREWVSGRIIITRMYSGHTCTVVDNIAQTTDNVWLRFVALVHDIAKPRTKAYQEGAGWTFHGHEKSARG